MKDKLSVAKCKMLSSWLLWIAVLSASSVLPTACDKTAHCDNEGVYSLFPIRDDDTTTGLVLVCENGVLNRICDQQWTVHDAVVACRELGYPRVGAEPFTELTADYSGDYPSNSSTVPNCTGSEDSLSNCSSTPSQGTCEAATVAAVRCLQHAPSPVPSSNIDTTATTKQDLLEEPTPVPSVSIIATTTPTPGLEGSTATPHPQTYSSSHTHSVSPTGFMHESLLYSRALETPLLVEKMATSQCSECSLPPLVAGMVGAVSTLAITVVTAGIVIAIIKNKQEPCGKQHRNIEDTLSDGNHHCRNAARGGAIVRNQAYGTTINSIPTAVNEAYDEIPLETTHDYEQVI